MSAGSVALSPASVCTNILCLLEVILSAFIGGCLQAIGTELQPLVQHSVQSCTSAISGRAETLF